MKRENASALKSQPPSSRLPDPTSQLWSNDLTSIVKSKFQAQRQESSTSNEFPHIPPPLPVPRLRSEAPPIFIRKSESIAKVFQAYGAQAKGAKKRNKKLQKSLEELLEKNSMKPDVVLKKQASDEEPNIHSSIMQPDSPMLISFQEATPKSHAKLLGDDSPKVQIRKNSSITGRLSTGTK